jgi:hypothetical protein
MQICRLVSMVEEWEDHGKKTTSNPMRQVVIAPGKVRRKRHVGI